MPPHPRRHADLRVLVHAVPPLAEPAQIVDVAARSSGRDVRYLTGSGGGWHALALACGGTDDCDSALRRLGAEPRFSAVQRDERKRVVSP